MVRHKRILCTPEILLFSVVAVAGVLTIYGSNFKTIDTEIENHGLQSEERLNHLDKEIITKRHLDPVTTYSITLFVKNQIDFDNLSLAIPLNAKTHKNILIEIEEGTYFSNTDHILIRDQILPECHLSIIGKGDVTVMATSDNLREEATQFEGYSVTDKYISSPVNPNYMYTDGEKLIHLSVTNDSITSGVKFIDKLFEKINPSDNKDLRYKLKCDILPNMSAEECRNLWLWATHSWISSYEKIDSVADGYIYLTANREIELYQCPLNTDYRSWKVMPRIKIVNQSPSETGVYVDKSGLLYLPPESKALYKCDKGSFLNIKNSELKSVEIAGIKFVGGNAPLIDINGITDYAYIHDCDFNCQQDLSIRLSTDNGIIKNNTFRNSMKTVIEIPNNGYRNQEISNNRFTNCGNRLLNQGCIKAAAENVLISDNVFHNNLISALNVGVWHGSKPKGKISAIVEDNLIYNDKVFLKDYIANSLLDVSMLYVYTKNDNVIIRRNRLHGFRTLASGNGIYIDDGAYNVNVYDNIVTAIDGKLYNINCRAKISEQAKENAPAYSTNNFIANNIIDGPIRFEAREDKATENYPESVYGGSLFLTKDHNIFKNRYVNVDASNDEIFQADNIDLTITVSQDVYDKLLKTDRPAFRDFIKKWVKVSEMKRKTLSHS